MKSRDSSNRRSSSGGGTGGALVREIGGIVFEQLRGALAQRNGLTRTKSALPQEDVEPPVVAQLMVEIRSDGSHTIARGALNDLRTGESAQIRAEGRTPSELMLSLCSSLLTLPSTVMKHVRATSEAEHDSLASDAPVKPPGSKG
jgi:hypothetical protein